MKYRLLIRMVMAAIVAFSLPACHHNTKSNPPPPPAAPADPAPTPPATAAPAPAPVPAPPQKP